MLKFDAVQFAEGTISLQVSPGAVLLLGAVLAVVVVAFFRSEAPLRVCSISLGLRTLAGLLLVLPLFEPRLVVPEVVPDENFVAVVVDASDSMLLTDGPSGQSRLETARSVLLDPAHGIWNLIAETFKVRLYIFAEDATRADSVVAASPGNKTNLHAALERVIADFRGLPLTGVVLITDGNTAQRADAATLAAQLRDQGIGLHVIGTGQTSLAAERELIEVVAHKGVGERTGAEIEVKVRSTAVEPDPVTFTIFDGDVPVFSESRSLKGSGKLDQIAFFFETPSAGTREYHVHVEAASGELNTLNNTLPVLVDTRRDTLRVLYFEGHLRQDFKFIKRALESDQIIEFASITRTGTGKYYRQGIRSPGELAGGFPSGSDALYPFDALILGDVEASTFSFSQMQLMESFVRVRGGGFLMMGGRNAFAEGDYAGTPVADMLPVHLDFTRAQVLPKRFESEGGERGFRFVPTSAGLEHPFMKLSPDPTTNRSLWSGMPTLTSINFVGGTKPGAQVVAAKPNDVYGPEEPVLVIQRYGKGRTAALATSSTWRWQMLLEAEDGRHERFWQQFARWIAESAPDRVNIGENVVRLAPEALHEVAVHVYDAAFRPLSGATVEGLWRNPDGTVELVSFVDDLAREGTYSAPITPAREGVYELEVEAVAAGEVVGRHARSYLVRRQNLEYYDATQKKDWLASLATVYYTPDEAADIPVNLRSMRTSTSVYRASYLWDMPLLLIMAVLLLCGEWYYRRQHGLR